MAQPRCIDAPTPTLSLVCPMYDEADMLSAFEARLMPVLQALGESFEIVCINDGSRDGTQAALDAWHRRDPRVRVFELSRNFGKEAALSCGIDHARGRAVIPIDADLQDPPELIPEMLRLWKSGYEVVLAQRLDRSSESLLKRGSAAWFYRTHNRLAEVPIPENVGDYRLLDRRVVEALKRLPERRRFMKGLFAWVGFRQVSISYKREPRRHGKTKFSGWRLWNLALEGITSFSTVPLRIWTYAGALVAGLSFCYGLFIVALALFDGRDTPGYASLITVVLFLGGLQLVGLGVIGEYLGRVHQEVQQRPVYLVRESSDDAS